MNFSARKTELTKQFTEIKAKLDFHLKETDKLQMELIYLQGSYQELERQEQAAKQPVKPTKETT